jgi:hypothetical protein
MKLVCLHNMPTHKMNGSNFFDVINCERTSHNTFINTMLELSQHMCWASSILLVKDMEKHSFKLREIADMTQEVQRCTTRSKQATS